MPDLTATCSLDIGCDAQEFKRFIAAHPDRTIVVYANTSAAVKACADWVVTSSIAVKVVDHLAALGEKIIWAPDRYLGNYIKQQINAEATEIKKLLGRISAQEKEKYNITEEEITP